MVCERGYIYYVLDYVTLRSEYRMAGFGSGTSPKRASLYTCFEHVFLCVNQHDALKGERAAVYGKNRVI